MLLVKVASAAEKTGKVDLDLFMLAFLAATELGLNFLSSLSKS